MGRFVLVVLLLAGALVILAQILGVFDVPALRDLPSALPIGQSPAAAEPPASQQPARTFQPLVTPSPAPPSTDVCTVSAPRFVHGAAELKGVLGSAMGDAVECERVVDAASDTEQNTTTGLAYYREQSNVAAFTNGFDHWALTSSGAVHWTGEDLEPPADAEPIR